MIINAAGLSTEPVDWLVDGMIPREGVVFAYGQRYVGKSLVFDVELPLAVGNPGHLFFGLPVQHGNVAVALGEGRQDAGIRLASRLGRQVADDLAAPEGTVKHPYTSQRLFYQTPFPCLVDRFGPVPGLFKAVSELLLIPDLALVVLDAARNFTGGASLSSSATAGRFMAGLTIMAETLHCCVLVVSHETADGKKMKGAGDLEDGADAVIAVTPDYDMSLDAGTLSCEKNK